MSVGGTHLGTKCLMTRKKLWRSISTPFLSIQVTIPVRIIWTEGICRLIFPLPSCIACRRRSLLLMDVMQSVSGCTGKYSMKVSIWSLAGMLMFLQSLYSHTPILPKNHHNNYYVHNPHPCTHTHTPARTDTYDRHFLISLQPKVWYMSYMWRVQRENQRWKWFGREDSVRGWAGAPSPESWKGSPTVTWRCCSLQVQTSRRGYLDLWPAAIPSHSHALH